jgi:hypothetical protein
MFGIRSAFVNKIWLALGLFLMLEAKYTTTQRQYMIWNLIEDDSPPACG